MSVLRGSEPWKNIENCLPLQRPRKLKSSPVPDSPSVQAAGRVNSRKRSRQNQDSTLEEDKPPKLSKLDTSDEEAYDPDGLLPEKRKARKSRCTPRMKRFLEKYYINAKAAVDKGA